MLITSLLQIPFSRLRLTFTSQNKKQFVTSLITDEMTVVNERKYLPRIQIITISLRNNSCNASFVGLPCLEVKMPGAVFVTEDISHYTRGVEYDEMRKRRR